MEGDQEGGEKNQECSGQLARQYNIIQFLLLPAYNRHQIAKYVWWVVWGRIA